MLLHADGSGACGGGSALGAWAGALGTCFAASSSPPACARRWRRADAQSVRTPPLLRPMLVEKKESTKLDRKELRISTAVLGEHLQIPNYA